MSAAAAKRGKPAQVKQPEQVAPEAVQQPEQPEQVAEQQTVEPGNGDTATPESEAAEPQPIEGVEVVMLIKITGTRDGQEWPDRGGSLVVPEGEATDLVKIGYAELA